MAAEPLLAPNGTLMETPNSIMERQSRIMTAFDLLRQVDPHAVQNYLKETASSDIMSFDNGGYVTPINAADTANQTPLALGYPFGDAFRRTQMGTMEFQMPVDQVSIINYSYKIAHENCFIGKALRVKTLFTCKGLKDSTANLEVNKFFRSVRTKLNLNEVYQRAIWEWNTTGLVVLHMSEPDENLSFIDLIDPRTVRVIEAYGQRRVFIVPDKRMIEACKDPAGVGNPLNKIYFDMIPKKWRQQIIAGLKQRPRYSPMNAGMAGEMLILLTPGSYRVIENRMNRFDRQPGGWDGAPLQPYFKAAEQYRMLMGGDFASAFVAKNLIALVSVGDPKAEGNNYIRPDQQALISLAQGLNFNSNQAQYSFVDPTTNIRYITPDPDTFDPKKYTDSKEQLKNLLPSPFWYSDGGSGYSGGTVEIKTLREEVEACNNTFDEQFWTPIYERAADQISVGGKTYVADKYIKPPKHDRNSLQEDAFVLQKLQGTYNSVGLSVRTVLEEAGYDYDTERERIMDQKDDVKKCIWMPAFEQKQGIVAAMNFGLTPQGDDSSIEGNKSTKQPAAGSTPQGGRPPKPGNGPGATARNGRQPRPSEA